MGLGHSQHDKKYGLWFHKIKFVDLYKSRLVKYHEKAPELKFDINRLISKYHKVFCIVLSVSCIIFCCGEMYQENISLTKI
jgi:hypothetical protein